MIVHRLALTTSQPSVAYGATLGQKHIGSLRERLTQTDGNGARVILDFSGIEAVSASYVKSTVLWLFQCGQLAAGVPLQIDERDPYRPIPFEVFPFVTGMVPEVEHEMNEVFTGRKLPCLEAVRWQGESVVTARLLGAPEETARRTLEFLTAEGKATATTLHERYPAERIILTAWNKRLAELYALRLATRAKEGRQWVYVPVAKEILYG